MTEIDRIVRTCLACPSQWEGTLRDGRRFYIRYRHGRFRMTAHATDPHCDGAEQLIHECDEGDRWGGSMAYDELREVLARFGIVTPAEEIEE